ncbi:MULTISPECIES: hypothetical protein [unclassified Leptolyngbya]|uniref:hypothetical protein n=1 Tax=unclassified Leptolyngbya TaxID=2650499 RepID=UPI001685CF30|nr:MULTISPECIES: hypothetical protein [unclassified Leptolyngbya]MBD1914250.1 hypothetical protein [Leptolyngbya sp. FACHB-8]MBD2157257.1 hypothetical protein [Leptolyngbya sp. FACHB-16]
MLASRSTPFTWSITLLFAAFVALLTLATGWAIAAEALPIEPQLNFSEAGTRFIRVWIPLSLVLTIILPTMGFIFWFRNLELRRILGFYLLAIATQLISEQLFGAWFSSLVVLIGTLYTCFRLWQLWHAREQIRNMPARYSGDRLLQGLLWILITFWACNLIMLFTLAWPTIITLGG